MPRWKTARCACRYAASSAFGRLFACGCAGACRARSGKNSSFSEASFLPERVASSLYTGYRRSGTSAWPRARSATNSFSASTARSMVPIAAPFFGACARPEKLPSIASQKRVAPASPTMRSAPLTWCRWSGQTRSTASSSGLPVILAMLSRTSFSAWSTSALIQDRRVALAMSSLCSGSPLCQLEARYRVLQPVGERGEPLRRAGGLLGALGGELGDAQNHLHVGRHARRRRRLLLRRRRDRADQLGQLVRHLPDLAQRLVGLVGGLGSRHHVRRAALHRLHRVLRVALNRLHDRADVLGRLGRAFGQPLHLLRHHREAASRLAGGGGLNRRVQRQHVGLLGNVRDQLHDLADLLRALAQALDPLRGLLDLLADVVHALDRVLHRLRTLLRGGEGR